METESLFSTPERAVILKWVLKHPDHKLRVRELAGALKLSPSLISKYLKVLRKENIITDNLNLTNPKTRVLKILFNLGEIEQGKTIDTVRKKITGTVSVGLYGSWADGTNHYDSDLDLWVKAHKKPSEEKIAGLEALLKDKLDSEVSILLLTDERINEIKDKDKVFYYALHHSINLWGEHID